MHAQILKNEKIFKPLLFLTSKRCFIKNKQDNIIQLPWSFPVSYTYKAMPITAIHSKPLTTTQFFKIVKNHQKTPEVSSLIDMLCNKIILKKLLISVNCSTKENYLQDHFIHWLSDYANNSRDYLQSYFSGCYDLNTVCKNFISFCFGKGISLDENKSLQSFSYHNQLSDSFLKQELIKITPKKQINMLGFGLDEGHYENSLAQFLISRGIAKTVKIYGFDPYALKNPQIEYLMPQQLVSDTIPKFDIVVARWVLHHVALQHRWKDLINCINNCNSGASVLIVEHGFLKEHHCISDKKLYYLLNATFDIIANIGLRPRYFTNSAPELGANFFIHYLETEDFKNIKNSVSIKITQKIFDIGPGFPNQTICSLSLTK